MDLGEFRKLTTNLPDTCKMVFDSEAVCFDCHLVEISRASLKSDDYLSIDSINADEEIILHYSMPETPFHFNKVIVNK